MPRRPKPPSLLVHCGNPTCRRALDAKGYGVPVEEGTPSERVYEVDRADEVRGTVLCSTCNHYTVNKPWREGEK